MALAFDTLGFAKDLEQAGVPRDQAEAHAGAARKYIMVDLVTKADLRLALESSENKMTIRIGTMLIAVVGAFTVLGKFFS